MRDPDQTIDRAIRALQEPVEIGDAFDRRVMAEVARGPAPRRRGPAARAGHWLIQPRTVRVSPLVALAAAAALVVALMRPWERGVEPGGAAAPAIAPRGAASVVPTRFMLVAPGASKVTLVGDFNDWSVDSTPLVNAVSGGLWTVTVPLPTRTLPLRVPGGREDVAPRSRGPAGAR